MRLIAFVIIWILTSNKEAVLLEIFNPESCNERVAYDK